MAIIHGKGGVVKFGALLTMGHVQSWNLDVTAEVAKAYSMGDDWQKAGAGVKDWSGSVEGLFDPADATQSGTEVGETVDLDLYPGGEASGGTYFSGFAIVTGTPISGTKDGWVSQTFNFTGNGALTRAAVA